MTVSMPVHGALEPTSAVVRILEEYLDKLETGTCLNPEELAARCPELAEPLQACLASLEFLQDAAAGFRGSIQRAQPTTPETQAELGRLGDFHLRREVGRGGMGVVYEAEQISLGRRVALKILPFAAALDARQLQRFKNEAQAAACLHHTNIVPVFGVGCERGVHYFAMQFIEGQTLAQVIADLRLQLAGSQKGPGTDSGAMGDGPERVPPAGPSAGESGGQSPAGNWYSATAPTPRITARPTEPNAAGPARFRTAARLAMQAALAIDHAHELGIVHRDIKPANLLVDGRGNLWVTDFGLAHCQSQAGLTMTGDLVGTLRYMSPEQALAQPTGVDQRTDIYSLGTTLYEFLTLRPAFAGRDRQELLRQIGFEEPIPLRRINKAVPAELETIVLKAMAKDARERYATANELADELERFLNDEPIRARRPTLVQRSRRWARRHRVVVWSATVGMLTALAVLAGSVGWIVREQAARRARAATDLHTAWEEAQRLRREGQWPRALAAAQRTAALLKDGAPEPELAEKVHGLLRELAEEENDRRLLARLDEIRLLQAEVNVKENRFVLERALPEYRQAFTTYGLGQKTMTHEEAAAWLRRRPPAVRATLAAALDHWLDLARDGKAAEADWLERVLALADTDTWRQRLRAARRTRDRRKLEQLAREVDVAAQPPQELFLLDRALAACGASDVALALLQRAQEILPGDFWTNHNLGTALAQCRRPRYYDAIRFLTAAVALRPDSPGARLNLGLVLWMKGQVDEALTAFRQALTLRPDYPDAHCSLGVVLWKKGRVNEAVAAFRQAIALRPNFAEALENLQNIRFEKGLRDEPLTAGRPASTQQRELAEAHCNRGNALVRKGRLDEAIIAYRRAIRLKADLVEGHFNLGLARIRQGRLDDAIAALRKTIDLKPDLAAAHYDLGNALSFKGRLDAAAVAYRRALALKPHYAEAFCNLGSVLQRQGKFAQALAAFQRGHELGSRRADWSYPSAGWVKECQRLGDLESWLPAIVRGEAQPAGAAECNEYARLCSCKKFPAAAAQLWANAFLADPKLADDLEAGCRYDAACAAILAGTGHGADAGRLSNSERARWRKQARQWLRADLAMNAKLLASRKPADRQQVQQRLRQWQSADDLAPLREPAATARLPAREQQACQQLWAEVEALLNKDTAP